MLISYFLTGLYIIPAIFTKGIVAQCDVRAGGGGVIGICSEWANFKSRRSLVTLIQKEKKKNYSFLLSS